MIVLLMHRDIFMWNLEGGRNAQQVPASQLILVSQDI